MSKMKQRMAFVMSLAMAFTSVDTGLLVSAEDMTPVAEESTVEVQDVEEEAEGEDVETTDEDVETDIVTAGEVAEQALGEDGVTVIEPQELEETAGAIMTYGDVVVQDQSWNVKKNYVAMNMKFGDKVTLKPEVNNPDNVPLTYKWTINEKVVSNEETFEYDSATVYDTDYNNYVECYVSDSEGYNGSIEFNMRISRNSNIEFWDFWGDNDDVAVGKPGNPFTLSVDPTSTELTVPSWSYQWYKYDSTIGRYVKIEGATAKEYTKVTEAGDCTNYRCLVGDGTTFAAKDFDVVADSKFDCPYDYDDYSDYRYTEVTAKKEETVVLDTKATTKYGHLSYKWYKEKPVQQSLNEDEIDVIGTNATVSVRVDGYETYYCDVTDGYESCTVQFIVSPILDGTEIAKSNLKVSASEKVEANKGESTDLTVNVEVDKAYKGNIDYTWEKWNGSYFEYTGIDDEKYHIDEVTDKIEIYQCIVNTEDDEASVRILVGSKERLAKVVTAATDFESARTISINGSESLISLKEKTKQYVKFVPDKDGVWGISVNSRGTILYNAEKEKLCSSEDGYLVYRLKANETYYAEVIPYDVQTGIHIRFLDYVENHKWKEAVVTKAATCTEAGEKAKECVSCGVTYYETIPALGHSFNAFTVTKEASVLEEGSQYHTCSVCGTVETVAIPKLVSNVTLINSTLPLQVKQKASLSKNVKGLAKGDKIVSCTLSAKDKKIVSVDKNGTVKGKKAGTATITMKFLSGATAKVKVKVQKKKVATSKITNVTRNITLKVKKSTKLAPVVTPITSKNKVTYKSSNKKIATVSSKGVIKAKKAGTATITVKSGSKTVKVKVKVTK